MFKLKNPKLKIRATKILLQIMVSKMVNKKLQ